MKAFVQTILNATAAGKAMLLAANAAAQKALLSLQNVDNTSDANKPVSTAQQTAIDAKIGGSVGATTNRLVKSSGTGGVTLQASGITVDSSNNITDVLSIGGHFCQHYTYGTDWGIGSANGAPAILVNGTKIAQGRPNQWMLAQNVGIVWHPTETNLSGSTTQDIGVYRASVGVVQIGTTASNALGSLLLMNMTASGLVCAGTYTVGTLPSASANSYKFANVSDSSETTFGSTVAAGGSSKVMVYSNGTNWTVCAA